MSPFRIWICAAQVIALSLVALPIYAGSTTSVKAIIRNETDVRQFGLQITVPPPGDFLNFSSPANPPILGFTATPVKSSTSTPLGGEKLTFAFADATAVAVGEQVEVDFTLDGGSVPQSTWKWIDAQGQPYAGQNGDIATVSLSNSGCSVAGGAEFCVALQNGNAPHGFQLYQVTFTSGGKTLTPTVPNNTVNQATWVPDTDTVFMNGGLFGNLTVADSTLIFELPDGPSPGAAVSVAGHLHDTQIDEDPSLPPLVDLTVTFNPAGTSNPGSSSSPGSTEPGTISGRYLQDNGSGMLLPGLPPLTGITVWLKQVDVDPNQYLSSVATDSNGNFSFPVPAYGHEYALEPDQDQVLTRHVILGTNGIYAGTVDDIFVRTESNITDYPGFVFLGQKR